MPEGTKVHRMYDAMVRRGYSKGKAARISQHQTGTALATGRPPKGKGKRKARRIRVRTKRHGR